MSGPTGAAHRKQRQVSPNRGNSRSLPNHILAKLIQLVDNTKSSDIRDYQLPPSLEFDRLGRRRCREKYKYYRDIKLFASAVEWRETTDWAAEELASESKMSEFDALLSLFSLTSKARSLFAFISLCQPRKKKTILNTSPTKLPLHPLALVPRLPVAIRRNRPQNQSQ